MVRKAGGGTVWHVKNFQGFFPRGYRVRYKALMCCSVIFTKNLCFIPGYRGAVDPWDLCSIPGTWLFRQNKRGVQSYENR